MWQTAVDLIRAAHSPVSFSGAGLSAESGIATFRDRDGIWAHSDPATYASQEGFSAAPALVIDWYNDRRRVIAAAQPNPGHASLARFPGMTHVTQNIDLLLEAAGASPVIHLHGVIDWDRCNGRCGHRDRVDPADPPPLRPCPECGTWMRPDVVWFGEQLPSAEWAAAEKAITEADLMLVAGTSAEVWPAAGLIELARRAGAAIVTINLEPTLMSGIADVELFGPAGEMLPLLLDS